MPKEGSSPLSTLALNTKVEEDFVAPLTALRGALEILRDFPELEDDERARFVGTALRGCSHLELAVEELAGSVYAASQQGGQNESDEQLSAEQQDYAARIKLLVDLDVFEIDFSEFVFSSAKIVDDFYDIIDNRIAETGRKWYFMVNFRDCRIWPEAWVAFAHRGKKVNVNHSLGTLRYAHQAGSASGGFDPDILVSRDAALAKIVELRSAAAP